MNKLYWLIISGVSIIVAVFIIYFGFAPESKAPEQEIISGSEASLLIDFGDNKQRMFVGDVVENMTVLDALKFSSTNNGFKYNFDKNIKTLAAIDGFSNNGKVWNLYMNGSLMKNSPDEIEVMAGDAVELKFEQNLQ
ncbi:MAG: hypothetical protein AAB397_03860 [Patescibacteria group bacterium]